MSNAVDAYPARRHKFMSDVADAYPARRHTSMYDVAYVYPARRHKSMFDVADAYPARRHKSMSDVAGAYPARPHTSMSDGAFRRFNHYIITITGPLLLRASSPSPLTLLAHPGRRCTVYYNTPHTAATEARRRMFSFPLPTSAQATACRAAHRDQSQPLSLQS